MKATSHIVRLSALAVLACGLNAGASEILNRSYLHMDLGGSFVQDVTIKDTGGAEASFNPGVAADFCFGYFLNDAWALEFETGVFWNSIDKVGGVSLDSLGVNIDLYQIPFKLNLVYHVPTQGSWTPYLGVGAGGMASVLCGEASGSSPIGSGETTTTDFTFTYQAFAGVKYKISENAQIDLGYRFLGTLDHDWEEDGANFRTEGIYTHAFVASFTWRF